MENKIDNVNKPNHYQIEGCNIESNLLLIRQDSGNSGTIISLCDKCLQELKKKIEALEEENERD